MKVENEADFQIQELTSVLGDLKRLRQIQNRYGVSVGEKLPLVIAEAVGQIALSLADAITNERRGL